MRLRELKRSVSFLHPSLLSIFPRQFQHSQRCCVSNHLSFRIFQRQSGQIRCLQMHSNASPADSDEQLMRKALGEAQKAYSLKEVPIGAVLTSYDGTILARGHNLVETCKDVTRHAEIVCLRNASEKLQNWRLSGSIMYTTIEPCPMCLSALALARVGRIVYGAKDLRLGACGTWIDLVSPNHPFHNFEDVTGGVLEEECAELMRSFFRRRRVKCADKVSGNHSGAPEQIYPT